ncbi:hypothetical protein HU230_0006740 [Bradyrhizobium quebecense]|uniref:Uncharacterized protein n=1 Tax=Bradyrhizobium quebecense TaxID=2748629 RepID=A0A973WPV3_9BRAD|nr:hypothetical protein [Bradyrhizobium quebecense]UGA45729.1 hypothetical protein HU230_0006740 [Bradyrhizobium quebecense]
MPAPAATYTVEAQISRDDRSKCEDVLKLWMAALNRHDASAMDALMHFPHARIAGGVVTVYQQPGNNPMDLFERLRKQDGWHHSVWNETKLVQSSPAKAHYAVRYTRYREDGSVIGIYDSLYVLSLLGGAWKIQSRSSFGP